MFDKNRIDFKKLKLNDLGLLFQWLNLPHVHEFYDKDKKNTVEDVEKRYAPKIRGEKPTDCYFVLYENKPVGYIQKYFVNDWPEFGNYLNYDDSVVSVDLFIGDIDFMGKGFGSLMLSEFINQVVFANPKVSLCVIGPEPNNKRAIRAYEKAGFKHTQTLRIGDAELSYIMELKKIKRLGVGLLIKNQKDEYLLHLRDGNTALMTNQWSLVGGEIKDNEIPEDAAKRELLEETGLHAGSLRQVRNISFNQHWDATVFEATVDLKDQEVILGEGKQLKFFKKDELEGLLDSLEYTNPFLEFLKEKLR